MRSIPNQCDMHSPVANAETEVLAHYAAQQALFISRDTGSGGGVGSRRVRVCWVTRLFQTWQPRRDLRKQVAKQCCCVRMSACSQQDTVGIQAERQAAVCGWQAKNKRITLRAPPNMKCVLAHCHVRIDDTHLAVAQPVLLQ